MHPYGVRDVEKLLGLPRSTIRALINAGFVSPARGPRNAWQFSFQDLIVLRTAQALATAKVSHRRITRSLKELRRHLPAEMPLSGLRIGAVGDSVVVREGGQQWHVDSGQYLLAFDGDPARGELTVAQRVAPVGAIVAPLRRAEQSRAQAASRPAGAEPRGLDADELDVADRRERRKDPRAPKPAKAPTRAGNLDAGAEFWFDRAIAQEDDDIDAAVHAYERAIAADPKHLEAHINFGRLLHEAGRLAQAERVYRAAMRNCVEDATVLFNLGVLLEDMSRPGDAVIAYEAAVAADPQLADGHYNLALLYEELQKPRDAIRHMAQYRRLLGRK